MKKRILLIGNDRFMWEAYEDGKYFILPKRKYIDTLYDLYEIDNISNYGLTSTRAVSLVESFVNYHNYDMCFISFNINEIKSVSLDMFEKNLQIIINMLICKGVFPVMMEFPESSDLNVSGYNKVINDLKIRNKFDNKSYNECLKLVNA